MNTNGPGLENLKNNLLFKTEVFRLVGCALEVHNFHGHGLNEKIYENSLVVECKLQGISFDQQRRFEVDYKGNMVGQFIPDLICFSTIIVDAKTIERITDHERGQMLNYLRVTKLQLGLIINFKHAQLEWKRIIL